MRKLPKRTLKIRLSAIAHSIVNRLAWKFAPEPSYNERMKPGYKRPFIWKLNDFVAKPHVDWYIEKVTGKTRKDWEKKK